MKRPAWFNRELPRDWQGGEVRVDGDDRLSKVESLKYIGKILGVIMTFWIVVSLWFCISNR